MDYETICVRCDVTHAPPPPTRPDRDVITSDTHHFEDIASLGTLIGSENLGQCKT